MGFSRHPILPFFTVVHLGMHAALISNFTPERRVPESQTSVSFLSLQGTCHLASLSRQPLLQEHPSPNQVGDSLGGVMKDGSDLGTRYKGPTATGQEPLWARVGCNQLT